MIQDIRTPRTPAATTPASAPTATPAPAAAVAFESFERQAKPNGELRLAEVLASTSREAASLSEKLPEHRENQVLVKLQLGASFAASSDFASDYGGSLAEAIRMPQGQGAVYNGDLLKIELPPGMTTAQAMVAMAKDPRVVYAAPNDIVHVPTTQETSAEVLAGLQNQPAGDGQPVLNEGPQFLPKDLSTNLWGMHNTGQGGGKVDTDIDAPEAWAITTGERKSVIAVIDTGGDYTHKALSSNVWTNPEDGTHGFNAITGKNDPMDDHYHGTHCYGTIAGNGTDGVYGVNHKALVMPIKFLSASGGGELSDAIKGITFATDHGARITSNSWGGGGFNQALKDAFANSPALHIIAAGNDSNNNDTNPTYPGSYDLENIVSVAASDRNDKLASFSNYGEKSVDLAAPGVAIYSTAPGNKYKYLDGTSMATPHVAGAADLIVAQYPDISNAELKARLLNSVDDVPAFHGKVGTGGRLNVARALAPDEAAPGTPGAFGVAAAKAGKVTLGWNASGDDGEVGGKAARYQVRISDRPIVDGIPGPGQVGFDEAQVVNAGRPGQPGAAERLDVTVPLSSKEKTYYFALKSSDKVGKFSEMVSTQASVPAASVAFEDDGSAANWTTTGWGQVNDPARGKVWTDSPDGNYANAADSSITSKNISLGKLTGSKLIFDAKYATEAKYDKVSVEVSTDGKTWNSEAAYSGSSDWKSQSVDLSKYDGKDVKFRFRMTSDGSVNGDGFSFANVVVAGGGN